MFWASPRFWPQTSAEIRPPFLTSASSRLSGSFIQRKIREAYRRALLSRATFPTVPLELGGGRGGGLGKGIRGRGELAEDGKAGPHQGSPHLSPSLGPPSAARGARPHPPRAFPASASSGSRLPPQQLLPTRSPPHLPSPSFLAPAPPLLRASSLPSPSAAAPCPSHRRSAAPQFGSLGAEVAAAPAATAAFHP